MAGIQFTNASGTMNVAVRTSSRAKIVGGYCVRKLPP
jgi:hypothetical protein